MRAYGWWINTGLDYRWVLIRYQTIIQTKDEWMTQFKDDYMSRENDNLLLNW